MDNIETVFEVISVNISEYFDGKCVVFDDILW